MKKNTDDPFFEIHKLLRHQAYVEVFQHMLSSDGRRLLNKFRTDPNHAFYILGDIEFKNENYVRAIYFFKRSLSVRRDDVSAMLALANCYDKLNQFKKAKSVLQKALLVKPRNQKVRFNLANAHFDLEEYEKAIALFKLVSKSEILSLSDAAKRNLKISKDRQCS